VRLLFLTPLLPQDLDLVSRPVTYLAWEVRAVAGQDRVRSAFSTAGRLPEGDDDRAPRPVADDCPAAACVFPLGKVGEKPVTRWLMVAYDDVYPIDYFGRKLPAYWRRGGMEMSELLQTAARQFDDLCNRCQQFDRRLTADLARLGGLRYASLSAIAYRQAFGGHKLAAAADGRPVVGAVFIKALSDAETWKKWAAPAGRAN
jgi:hypothetical protein